MEFNMKIGEASKVYSAHINELWDRKIELTKLKKENEKNNNYEANEGIILELSNIDKQYNKASKFMDSFNAYKTGLYNMEVSKQQGKTMSKYAEDAAKCMEIARRISKGEKVPMYDEKRLMKFNFELYMIAKSTAIMNRNNSDKKHKSLWEDEEETTTINTASATEIVDNMECTMEMPE